MARDAATHCAVKLSLDAKALPPGSGRGNLRRRIVLAGAIAARSDWVCRLLAFAAEEGLGGIPQEGILGSSRDGTS